MAYQVWSLFGRKAMRLVREFTVRKHQVRREVVFSCIKNYTPHREVNTRIVQPTPKVLPAPLEAGRYSS